MHLHSLLLHYFLHLIQVAVHVILSLITIIMLSRGQSRICTLVDVIHMPHLVVPPVLLSLFYP